MLNDDEAVDITRRVLDGFCKEFLKDPYLCYTEHGHHYRFASQLYNALPIDERYHSPSGIRMCRVQKEYPTHTNLSRSRRQHWDVSLISKTDKLPECPSPYDHLQIATVVEFGLNCDLNHLIDDIDRLSHKDSNVSQGFIAHLFRLHTEPRVSARDWSPDSRQLHTAEEFQPLLRGKNIEIYFGVYNPINTNAAGLWRITADSIVKLTPAGWPGLEPLAAKAR